MTYVIGGEDVNDFDELVHYGKKGMKWGVRNDKRSSSSPRPRSSSAKPKPKLTAEQAAQKAAARKKVGKQVMTAVVAAAGGVAVGALAGPIAGAAVGAAIRGVVEVASPQPSTRAEIRSSPEYRERVNELNSVARDIETG